VHDLRDHLGAARLPLGGHASMLHRRQLAPVVGTNFAWFSRVHSNASAASAGQ